MAATIDQVIDALLDNADFEESDSLSKARTFISAANRFFILVPLSQGSQGDSMTMGHAHVKSLLERAHAFVSAKESTDPSSSATAQVRFFSIGEGFRR